MTFDKEGHVDITPAEFERLLVRDLDYPICAVLVPGTPAVFSSNDEFCEFRNVVADGLSVHPSSIVFRGSTKIGFSISPKACKLWKAMTGASDIDLAVVDPDHYHFLDAEVRRWERIQRNPASRSHAFRGALFARKKRLRENRSFYCYKYMDLPDTELVQKYQTVMDEASSRVQDRTVTAFFYRDWWALHARYEYDLRQLRHGVRSGELPSAPKGD